MAAVAELGDSLKGEHVAVRRAVWSVAGHTALDPHGSVFENEWPSLVGVAARACLVFETTENHSILTFVGIVARGAVDDPLLETMTVVVIELGKDLRVTTRAGGGRCFTLESRSVVHRDLLLQRPSPSIPAVHVVTVGARQPGSRVVAGRETRVLTPVAPQTVLGLQSRKVVVVEAKGLEVA